MTREELNTSIDENVTDRTVENPSSAPLIGAEMKNVADYVDGKTPLAVVVLRVSRDGGSGEYTVTELGNSFSGTTFSAADQSTSATRITASSGVFANSKTTIDPIVYATSGGANLWFGVGGNDLTTSIRDINWFKYDASQNRPNSFNVVLKISVYP